MKIFVAGDTFFRPDLTISRLKEILSDSVQNIEYDSVTFPFPISKLDLSDEYVVPSGMAWDQNMDGDYGTQGVREYYGRNDTLKGLLKDCNILIIHGAALPASVIDEAEDLQLICCMRGGPVNIDLNYAKSKGILVSNSPGKNAQAVAEFTIGLLLSHMRHIPEGIIGLHNYEYRNFNVYDTIGFELEGKNFGLIGFGNIAQRLNRILKGFGCHVFSYDPYVPEDVMKAQGVEPVSLEDLLRNSDIVSVHARAKAPLIGKKELEIMKPHAILVNTARGVLVDYPALKEAVEKRQIGGAAVDVFGPEPFAFYHEWLNEPGITATPHLAGGSKETVQRGIEMTGQEIRRFLRGEPLKYEL